MTAFPTVDSTEHTDGTEDDAVVVTGLRKRYGSVDALAGVDLLVPRGTVCGLLGPNGAGKTTAVRILTTLLRADGGRATVAGFDVARQPAQVRARIGLVGQSAAVDEILSGRQNLVLFGRLNHLGRERSGRRADELLDRFALADAGDLPVERYSGGMRRRLDLAVGLITSPSVLFLDEPTTGLDPRGRAEVWAAVRALVAAGTTVLLTTQYLEEVDQLADAITVIDSGRVIAEGSADRLKSMIGGDRVEIVLRRADDLSAAAAVISEVTGGRVEVDPDARRIRALVADRSGALVRVVRALDAADLETEDVGLRRPTLDEVFMHLTGQQPGAAASPARSATTQEVST
jgi:ABC-2 type transport system ATP-binding protein